MSRRLRCVIGIAVLAHAVGLAAERPARLRLVEITTQTTPASQSILITSTAPASYTTRQPDPLTVLVTLRDVAAGEVVSRLTPDPSGPVSAVDVMDAVDGEGATVAQVRITLREPATYEVRSRRETIQVRFARLVVTDAGRENAPSPPLVPSDRPATAILSVKTTVEPDVIRVTVRGDGVLSPTRIHEAEHMPPRLVLDFPGLAVPAATQTVVQLDPVQQVRVSRHSPEVSRVVLDLARPTLYEIAPDPADARVLSVVFPRDRAIDPVARIGGPKPVLARTRPTHAPARPAPMPAVSADGGSGGPIRPATDYRRREARARPAARVNAAPVVSPERAVDVTTLTPVARYPASAYINAGQLGQPSRADLPLSTWPAIARLQDARWALITGASLLAPGPHDLPLTVADWPAIARLQNSNWPLAAGAALWVPASSDLPPMPVPWPIIPQLADRSPVAFGGNTLPAPEPSDLPVAPVPWPIIAQLEGPSWVVPPGVALSLPTASDLPPVVVSWPELPRLAGTVGPLPAGALALQQPMLDDLPTALDWPQIQSLPTTMFVVDTAMAPRRYPSLIDLPAVVVVPAPRVDAEPAAEAGSELAALALSPGTHVFPLVGTGRPAPASFALGGGQQLPGQTASEPSRYTGDPISMDFQGADLRAVLRVFASDEVSGLNLVVDPSVQGEVNVDLTEVPWDQAFDIILRANQLAYEIDGTVVRIASIQQLQEEAQDRALLAQREAEAGELVVFTKTLSYARAEDLVQLITQTSLSPRGEVFTDPRTNTLIVRDLAERLATLDALLETLDRAEPQVEIEARIVQASHNSARALGVQWGVTGRASQELGNSLPFQFPNRGGITGRSGAPEGQGPSGLDPRALPQENAATAVDLGVAAATSAVGITLGSVNGSLNLDVVLSALESAGELRIISSPRVTTQNNVEAQILQGDQIPYQTVANNTVTVQFKEAALTLLVTPQITASKTVIMQVDLENSFADFGRALGDPPIPSIVTQRARTTIQVADGETTVIGGIFENTQNRANERTPMLHRIPLLGWLFKSEQTSESTDELMIFLTPRILVP